MKDIWEVQREREKGILLSPKTRLPWGLNGEQASFYVVPGRTAISGFGHIKQIPGRTNPNKVEAYEVTFLDTSEEQVEVVLDDDLSAVKPPDAGMTGINYLSDFWAKAAIDHAIGQAMEADQKQAA